MDSDLIREAEERLRPAICDGLSEEFDVLVPRRLLRRLIARAKAWEMVDPSPTFLHAASVCGPFLYTRDEARALVAAADKEDA